MRVAVIGGGISGLAAAHRLMEIAPQLSVHLFESKQRMGGILETSRPNGFLVEHSADMFTTNEAYALRLSERIGFEHELISTNSEFRRAFVIRRGKLVPIPEGFALMNPTRVWPMVASPLMSWRGKLRLAAEYFVPAKRDVADESMASFVRRRLGREAYERLVQPLVGGIYTADPEKLSMAATLDRFLKMEREHGGLIRATLARQALGQGSNPTSAVRYNDFVTPRRGMSSFVEAIARRLPESAISLNQSVIGLQPLDEGRWRIRLDKESLEFDAVIVATPAHPTAQLLRPFCPSPAEKLSNIPMASAAIVALGYQRDQIGHRLDGFGFVVPIVEQRRILACSMSSVKFPDRAPPGLILLRVFVGGAVQPELFALSDHEIESLVQQEVSELLSIRGPPIFQQLVRWTNAMPQYHVGHCDLIARIERELTMFSTLQLAGNAYHGVGIPQCVRSGEQAAQRIVELLRHSKGGAGSLSE